MPSYFTFVVPAYNVADYIEVCLDSIVHQTRKGFRVIIVNDGSSDGRTPAICDLFAAEYPRLIRVVHQENKGLGGARNTGLQLADSKYVMFLDSDDYLDPFFFENFVEMESEFGDHDVDMIFTLPHVHNQNGNTLLNWMDSEVFLSICNKRRLIDPNVDTDVYKLEVNACRIVCNTGFLERIDFKFEEGIKYEDFFPFFSRLHKARSALLLPIRSFYYRIDRPGQITMMRDESRLDIAGEISRTLDYMYGHIENRSIQIELLRKSFNFARWCIGNSSTEVRVKLVDKMHAVFQEIPKPIFRAYSRSETRKLSLYAQIIRSPLFFWILKDNIYTELLYSKLFARRSS